MDTGLPDIRQIWYPVLPLGKGGAALARPVMPTPVRTQQGNNPENTIEAVVRDTNGIFFPREAPTDEDTVPMEALKGPPVPEGNLIHRVKIYGWTLVHPDALYRQGWQKYCLFFSSIFCAGGRGYFSITLMYIFFNYLHCCCFQSFLSSIKKRPGVKRLKTDLFVERRIYPNGWGWGGCF